MYFDYNDYYNGSYPEMMSWKVDSDCCSWDGVTCDAENGEVIGLDLSNSWLYGPLNSNSNLFSLRHLRKLNLDSNNFSSSTIPSEFGQLVRLTHLNLSFSFLHGPIPLEISWLSNLVSLDLSFNYFKYFVGGDYYYKLLDLRRIHLEALFQNMTYLRALHLNKGKFPSDIFLLPKIQVINLSYNRELVGFLPKFWSFSSLKELRLWTTNFSGEFTNSIDNLGSLNVLDLSETNLFGELPNSISNLKSLNYLDLSSSNISGASPPSIGNLSQLTYLSLSYNNLHGQLPSTSGNLAKLTHLSLDNILYYREVPSFLGNLTQLEDLSLSNNNFDCGFPIWLTNITKHRSIVFLRNQLKGKIPSEISRLPNLSSLDLSQSSFIEAIPSVLFTIPSLYTLVLDQNQLILPLKFQNISLSPLYYLGLSENKMNELMLGSIVNFTKLQYLRLSSINLEGMVELNNFFKLKELQSLDLSGNEVFVSKANINSTLPKFSSLWLSSFNLSKFPTFLEAQNELQNLDLSNNDIEGNILLECWKRDIGIPKSFP
ncbi:receptor-like protein 7 [Quercus lobata]|uniref:receptor-like protein 7 n=1 Tax=Quercus lobata TaxID=97700 RepID=UPI0012454C07|nr:receptor-like protein 7 [Quercus lobata]